MKLVNQTATAINYANLNWTYSPCDSKKIMIGGWTAIAWQEQESDYNYYSKAWHRAHGAKITVTGRFVRFTSPSGKKVKTVELESWRGNWQMKALVESGLVKAQSGAMNIRLNSACEIKQIGKRLGVTFYARSLKGEHLDYCAVSALGMTYHAASPIACVRGLKLKQATIERKQAAVINWAFLRKLGFCQEGIKEFCYLFGFELSQSVTPQEVYDQVMTDRQAAAPFAAELRKLAEVVGFDVPELV